MRRLLAVLTHAALRLVTSFMIAAGLAALVAVIFVMRPPSSDWTEWIEPIRRTALGLGFAFLGAAVIALKVLPSRREFVRAASSPSESGLTGGISSLLVGLAAASAWQLPMLFRWWEESRRLVQQLTAGWTDPLGLWIIPAVLVSAPPFIATLVVGLFILTASAVVAARPPLAVRILRACVLVQGGLVVGSSLALPPIQNLVARVLALAASSPDAGVLATVTEAVAPQNFFAAGLLFRFQLILGGYVLVALAMSYWPSSLDSVGSALRSDAAVPLAAVPNVTVDTASPLPATVPSAFDSSAYRVRLRTDWILAAFRVGYRDYTITPMPARARDAGFAFSGRDGSFRREPDGPALLTVQPEGGKWTLKTSYVVADRSGGVIGFLEPVGADWKVLDRFRRPLAQLQEVDARRGYCRYSLRVDGAEVCRFTWAIHSFGVWSAEMDIEFLNGAAGRIDPAYVMALAPLLESQARRLSQWVA